MRYLISVMLIGLVTVSPVAYAEGERSVEYNLAIIQTGSYVAPDDPLVFMFGTVLDSLGSRCQESRLQLGTIAVGGVDVLRRDGVYSETPLSLLQGLDNAVIPELFGPDHPARCTEYMALLETLLEAN
jgi:hypothetical protein